MTPTDPHALLIIPAVLAALCGIHQLSLFLAKWSANLHRPRPSRFRQQRLRRQLQQPFSRSQRPQFRGRRG